MSLLCLPINKEKISNTINKIKQKLGIKYFRLNKDDDMKEMKEMKEINLNTDNNDSDDDIYNEPLEIKEIIPNNLTDNEIKKKKILLNKIFLLFENNNFELDIKSVKKINSDAYFMLKYIEMQDPYYKCYHVQKEKLFLNYKKNLENIDEYEMNSKKEIYHITNKYFVNFETLYGSNTLIHTGLCGICMKNIYISEYQCYSCNKVFFDKCDNETHNKTNESLPLKKRFSNDFINHIRICLLNNNYVINELYDYYNK
jgi:hypothetical protein